MLCADSSSDETSEEFETESEEIESSSDFEEENSTKVSKKTTKW